ncbi:hypothetical protein Mal4_48710 [Maioricimonas rarisocia]|uniref:DUF5615 domain-containing protein n=1 Tax=Maioricimonas rarisocia TaxID=2528026 RepID=A0A517ZDE8_9PLAN|nr:DUF5615 family PIN-like protein [Maioricimonas rarisocia]QDU40513.1 hypothetical protein Mal4_48710 [Maioricimonas rarisocia]
MPSFLANENIPRAATMAARAAGIDIAWFLEEKPGSSDEDVLREAAGRSQIPVTFDKDFGELAFRGGKDVVTGILLLRPKLRSPDHVARFLTNVPQQPISWQGHFVVADGSHLRQVPLL